MIYTHKIRINPNNEQKTQIEKSFGVARFTYNWILERYKKNFKDFSIFTLKNEFNAIKAKEYPFVLDVSKYVSQAAFINFKETQRIFKDALKNKKRMVLHYKTKRDKRQVYYVGGDHTRLFKKEGVYKDYLKLPKMPALKLTENLRFSGRITSVRVVKEYDKYYVVFNVEAQELKRKEVKTQDTVGVDLGIKHHITLSNGLQIDYPKSIEKTIEKIKRMQKRLSKKKHPRTKGDKKVFSNNYMKQKAKLDRIYGRLNNIKIDYEHKLAKILAQNYKQICMEDLEIDEMYKDRCIARCMANISFYRIKAFIEHKTLEYDSNISVAEKYYPSSKKCSTCGSIKTNLTLKDRVFICPKCGCRIDRDLNAAINLRQEIGRVASEFKPLDLENVICDLNRSHIKVSKVE